MDGQAAPKSKLWIGGVLMCAAVLVWIASIKLAMGSLEVPAYKPGASMAEIEAQLARTKNPSDMVSGMLIGYGASGMIFIAGLVVTGLGMIDYAAALRRRG